MLEFYHLKAERKGGNSQPIRGRKKKAAASQGGETCGGLRRAERALCRNTISLG
ncbi:MAG: hypothetical protein IAF94_21785 [Pirellulaceae bacterium]|nr:hypothetical protein [Pirellulaceae bacterium]